MARRGKDVEKDSSQDLHFGPLVLRPDLVG